MRKLTMAVIVLAALSAGLFAQSLEVRLQRAEQKEIATGDLKAAINEYKRIANSAGKDVALAARALLRMAEAQQQLSEAEADKIYQQIVRDYPNQVEAAVARTRLSASGGRSVAAGVVNRHVWTLPENAAPGRVSPDGRYFAFTTGTDLVVRDIASKSERTVARFDKGKPGPTLAWSPDGRRIAFQFGGAGAGNEIRTINLDGSGMNTLLSYIRGFARVLDFFPDGNRVLCSRNEDGDSLVFALNIADRSVQRLTVRPGGGGSGWPRLSPDGRYIALRNSPGLSLLATDGSGQETILTRNSGDLNAAGWAPDGRWVLFVREQNGRMDLWAAPLANGRPSGPASLVYRDFGSARVFENQLTREGSLFYVKSSSSSEGEVYTASVDFNTGKLLTEPVTEFSQGAGGALWSPDGKSLVYASNGPLSSGDWLVRFMETGETRSVTPKVQSLRSTGDWSADGQRISAIAPLGGGQSGIFFIDVQTGDAQQVSVLSLQSADGASLLDEPKYSPHTGGMFFRRRIRDAQGRVVYAVLEHALATGQQRVVFDESERPMGGVLPSPDGRYLAYGVRDLTGSKDTYIRIRPLGAGEERQLRVSSAEASYCHPTDWLKDGSAIVYHCDVPEGGGGQAATWLLPLATMTPRKLDVGFGEVTLKVHPDGRRVALSVIRPNRAELHVLENFQPSAK